MPEECGKEDEFFRIVPAINVGTDVLVLALPAPAIWQLNMSLQQKLQVSGIFLLGAL